jgi:hypothetical protein
MRSVDYIKFPPGRAAQCRLQEYWKPSFLTEISDAAIDTMLVWSANRSSPLCHVVIEHTLDGQ